MSEEPDRVAMVSDLRTLKVAMVSDLRALKVAMLSDLKALEQRFERRLKQEGKTTRRHFDVVAERIEASVKLVAEGFSHHATVLDDHEVRLQKIEKRS